MPRKNSLKTALRANIGPAAILWSAVALMLTLYYTVDSVHTSMQELAAVKQRMGLWFVMPAQAVFGGLLPCLFQFMQRGGTRPRALHIPWLMAFWAVQGALTDTFYKLQAAVFGDTAAAGVIATKTAVDMLFYSPFISIPLVVFAYALKDAEFSVARTRSALGRDWPRTRVVPIWGACLLIWTPTVCVIYSLPQALQFPVQSAVQCFFALILVIMTRHEPAKAPPLPTVQIEALEGTANGG